MRRCPTAKTTARCRDRRTTAKPRRYPVTGELGAGGMGLVYRVQDRSLERELAAKVLRRDDPRSLDKFILEAKITGLLEHPNIVPIHELGTDKDGQHSRADDYGDPRDMR
ncbi:hypothetical protein JYT15_00505 [Acidimicrobium ferrooxidans]|nr:hypothetical protein [Acidimicrobium ferrooxidans]